METNISNLNGILQWIELIQNKLTKCWESFVLCDITQGFNILSEIFVNMEELIAQLKGLELGEKNKIDFSGIDNLFIKLEKCIIIKDYQGIADLVYYHMKPLLKNWGKLLNKYMKHIIKQ